MSKMDTDYAIPISKNTVDRMMETLISENERLSKENKALSEKLEQADSGQDPAGSSKDIAEAIERLLN